MYSVVSLSYGAKKVANRHPFADDAKQRAIRNAPTEKVEPVVDGIWQYYVNDEGKARWRCNQCGKICRRDPHDKHRCASCGAHMRKEA